MAGRKAAGKLADSLLPSPADWILKVVQGACQAEAPELRISQTNKATHLELQLPYLLDVRALESCLTRGTSPSQPGMADLCTALRVLGLGQQRAWVARLKTGETTHWVLVKDGEASLETVTGQDGPPGRTEVLIGVAFPPGESGKLGGLVRFGAAIQTEHEALVQRARCCPIPLLLDGRRLDTLERTESVAGFEHEVFLGVTVGVSPTLPAIAAPRGLRRSEPSQFGDRFLDPRPFHLSSSDGAPLVGSSVLRMAFRYQVEKHAREGKTHQYRALPTPSRVLLVRHGVLAGRRNLGLTEPVAVDIYLNADDMRSDLSGLAVEVQPEHVEAAREEIRNLGPFLEELRGELLLHQHRPKPLSLALYGGLSGVALVLTPWPVKLTVLGLSAYRLHDLARQQQRVVDDCRHEVAEFRQRYCQPMRVE